MAALAMLAGTLGASAQLRPTALVEDFGARDLGIVQTWDIASTPDGWSFFATRDALCIFNDVEWQQLSHPSVSDFRSVAIDRERGRVYVGSINEFGYFAPDARGVMSYTDLSAPTENSRLLGNVWGIYPVEGYLLLQGDRVVLRLNLETGKSTLIPSDYKLDCSATVNGVLYLGSERGLDFVVGDEILPVAGAEALEGKRIRAILPYNKGVMVVTARDGAYVYSSGRLERLAIPGEARIFGDEVFCAAINGSQLALGTIRNGVSVVDLAEGTSALYNEANGLSNNTVLSLHYQGNDLWAGLDAGLQKILLGLPVSALNNETVPFGTASAFCRRGPLTYLGSNRALYVLGPGGWEYLPATTGQVWGLAEVCGDLLCAHDRGLFKVDGTRVTRIDGVGGAWGAQPLLGAPESRAIVGTYDGLQVIERSAAGAWIYVGRIDGYSGSAYNFVQTRSGEVWVNEGNDGMIRLRFDPATLRVTERRDYPSTASGIPLDRLTYMAQDQGNPYVCTPGGLFRYSPEADGFIYDEAVNQRLGGPRPFLRIRKVGGYLFALNDKEILRVPAEGEGPARIIPLMPLGMHRIRSESAPMFPIGEERVVLTDGGNYTLYDFSLPEDSIADAAKWVRINEVTVTTPGDSLVYAVNFLNASKNRPELDYANNSLRIRFGSPEAALAGIVSYRYRLNDGEWTAAQGSTVKEYTNLREGKYRFEVMAVNARGDEASDTFEFTVLPPWYRGPWMQFVYFILALGLLGCIVLFEKWRVDVKERNMQREKEAELGRQQQVFEEEKRLKDTKIRELEAEQLQTQLEHKSQEMASALMTLAGKNEVLITIKEELKAVRHKLPASSEGRKALEALEGTIDGNINNDILLKRFEQEFDIVHYGFIKKLRAAYPTLTSAEVMMCAYIRADLSTKEMAPLLNISARGVETMRYRIRKKFGLTREESLTEFLAKIEM